jgi:hypothetical protein
VVRVALHVDRTTAASPSVPLQGAAPTGVIVADPLRPLLYGFDQAGADSTLRTWNVHTGALVNTLPLPSVRVSQAHVSPDGSLLLIADSLNRKLVPVGLRPGAITLVSPWNTMRFPDGAADFGFARLNGSDVIVWSGGQLLSAESSASLANHEFFPASLGNSPASLAVAADGRRGCMILHTANGAQLLYLVQGNRAGRFSGGIAEPLPLADGAHRCALDATGDNVFVTGDSGLRRFAFQGRDSIRRTAASSAVTLQLLANGEIYAVGGTQWLHLSSQLDELGRRTLAAGSVDGVISGDETRLLERVVDGTQVTATLRDRDF